MELYLYQNFLTFQLALMSAKISSKISPSVDVLGSDGGFLDGFLGFGLFIASKAPNKDSYFLLVFCWLSVRLPEKI